MIPSWLRPAKAAPKLAKEWSTGPEPAPAPVSVPETHTAPSGTKWPRDDAAAAFFLRKKYSSNATFGKKNENSYMLTRRMRLAFFKDFAAMRASGITGTQAYSEALSFFGKMGMPARAQSVFDLALADHVLPNTAMYLRLLQAYAKVGDIPGLLFVLRQSKRHLESSTAAHQFITYCLMGLHRAGKRTEMVEAAVQTWEVHQGHPTIYRSLITSCNTYSDGGALITEMVNRDLAITEVEWGAFLDSTAHQGDVLSSLKVLKVIREMTGKVTEIMVTQLLMSLYSVGDSKMFARVYQMVGDKNYALDTFVVGVNAMAHGVVFTPASTRHEAVEPLFRHKGGQKSMDFAVGVHAASGDFASAYEVFNRRGDILGSQKIWLNLMSRLAIAARFERMMSEGGSAWRLIEETFEENHAPSGVMNCQISLILAASRANQGFGCLCVWRQLRSHLASRDRKRQTVPIRQTRQLADLLAGRFRSLHRRGGYTERCSQLLSALEEMYALVYDNSPFQASCLLSPLLIVYSELQMLDKAVDRYRVLLLAGHPLYLLEHAPLFEELFRARDDAAALHHIAGLQEKHDSIYHTFQRYL
eukprot:Rhum_TRINITY_DN13738_c0_g2::Rhum_TRINITY_DN13738_c0_g2_i1::g.63511::m.63511